MLSRAHDSELGAVARLLRKIGVPCVRLNADELASAGLLVDPACRIARLAGQWVVPAVTWIRHFSARAIEDPLGPVHQLFTQDSWTAAADSLAGISAVAIRSCQPDTITQLRLAAQHGVRVPQTYLVTDPSQLAGLFPGQRVIVKPLHQHFVEAAPGLLSGVFPLIMPSGDLAGQSPGPPVVVQEYIEHQAELRVYYVAGSLHGFEISKRAPASPWLDDPEVTARPVPVSRAVAGAAETIASAFRLRYGAFDFLLRDGEPVFLEVNAAGDWRWIERKTGSSPVSEAVARMLRDLHQAQLLEAGAPREPFSLLSFLAG
jgi:hypothetical protein